MCLKRCGMPAAMTTGKGEEKTMRPHYFAHRLGAHMPSFVVGWIMGRIGRKLRLDSVQRSYLSELFAAMQRTQAFMADIYKDRHGLIAEILAEPELDREKVLQLLIVPERAYRDQLPPLVDVYGRFHDSLSTDQRNRLVQYLRKCA